MILKDSLMSMIDELLYYYEMKYRRRAREKVYRNYIPTKHVLYRNGEFY